MGLIRKYVEKAKKRAREIFGDVMKHIDILVCSLESIPLKKDVLPYIPGGCFVLEPQEGYACVYLAFPFSGIHIGHEIMEVYGINRFRREYGITLPSLCIGTIECDGRKLVYTITEKEKRELFHPFPYFKRAISKEEQRKLLEVFLFHPFPNFEWAISKEAQKALYLRARFECCGYHGEHLFHENEDIIERHKELIARYTSLNLANISSYPKECSPTNIFELTLDLANIGATFLYNRYVKGSDEELKELLLQPLPSTQDIKAWDYVKEVLKKGSRILSNEEIKVLSEEVERKRKAFEALVAQKGRILLEEML